MTALSADVEALDDIRLITVRPPWSFAISHLGKTPENRTRSTSYRGLVGIHAGKSWDALATHDRRITAAVHLLAGSSGMESSDFLDPTSPYICRGHVVALAELVDCHPDDGQCCRPWGERSHSTVGTGLTVVHHLVLAGAVPLTEPIPARGQLGLPWRPDALLAALLHATPEAADRRQRLVATGSDADGYVADKPRCRDCGCPAGVHNAPQFGGGCWW